MTQIKNAQTASSLNENHHIRNMVDVEKLPADQAVHNLVKHAVDMAASDLFITSNEQHVAVLVRLMGMMMPISVVSTEQGRRLMSHIKAMAGMDLAERRRPHDGRWIYTADENGDVDLRINTIPTIYGEDYSIRLLPHNAKLFDMDHLGMHKSQRQQLNSMIDSPGGLILITGPTGSGKTATLYACLNKLNDGRRKINTIEDPIEFTLAGLRQSQINPQIGLGFSELLRSVMRQSPDVIMIGEIRDVETAQIAIHAANSGHLVLATIHATSAAGGIQSMRALGVHQHFLATSLLGAISQRLVRTLCPHCKIAFDLVDAPHTFDEVTPFLAPGEGKHLYAHHGCDKCRMLGYSGRTGVFEIMSISRTIRNMIADNQPVQVIRKQACNEHMLEFRPSALLKVARGETSTEEVFRVIPAENLMLDE
jgi:type II secretory ATPase GspE/PulE/Tfp pilus assembly ATPase PilB-like protein